MLFADVDGKQIPVTRSTEGNNYQVSWTVDPAIKASKKYHVRYNVALKLLKCLCTWRFGLTSKAMCFAETNGVS